ncbi:MAG: HPr family phosphocarrier protein [Thermodesulfobacteriota bacterium]|nr:HPr family phosphocarrier protein [Thermodesulfobacteriota bacterium]
MLQETVMIKNELGLHARAAAMFAKKASGFSSNIRVTKDHTPVDAKSIMELLTIAAARGSKITISANGMDEKEAIRSLVSLVNNGFGEDK